MPVRDSNILIDVQERLTALDVFDAVHRGSSPGEEDHPVGDRPVCWLQRAGWQSQSRSADPERHRTVSFRIWIDRVRAENPEERSEKLQDVEEAVVTALDGKHLGGVCMPAFTAVVSGAEDPRPAYKAGRVLLTLSCRYRTVG